MAKRKNPQEIQQFRFPRQVGDQTIEHGCGWNERGVTCDKFGHLSTTTDGTGPWYCGDHFADLMHWKRNEESAKPVSATVEAFARQLKEPWRSRALAKIGKTLDTQ